MGFAEAEQAKLAEELETRQERLTLLSHELRSVSRALHHTRRRLEVVQQVAAADRDQLARDYDELLTLPGVRSVEPDGACVRVLTDTIVIEYEGDRIPIGEFALELDLERGIKVVNLRNTSPKSGWDHPHVQAGQPCLGNLREGFEKLLGECTLVPLVAMLLQFLETYTPSTAYCSIDLWRSDR
jgi:hypothetical protein